VRQGSPQSRLVAGVLLIVMPAVVYGGASILPLLTGDPVHAENEFRQDLWRGARQCGRPARAGSGHLALRGRGGLPGSLETLVRHSTPAAAVLLPVAFFPSVNEVALATNPEV
jgi:hypothetical protein